MKDEKVYRVASADSSCLSNTRLSFFPPRFIGETLRVRSLTIYQANWILCRILNSSGSKDRGYTGQNKEDILFVPDFLSRLSPIFYSFQISWACSPRYFIHSRLPEQVFPDILFVPDFMSRLSPIFYSFQTSWAGFPWYSIRSRLPEQVVPDILFVPDFMSRLSPIFYSFQTSWAGFPWYSIRSRHPEKVVPKNNNFFGYLVLGMREI